MTANTEALRAKFEAWAVAEYSLNFDDDTPLKRYLWAAYQAGHAAAKAETAAPVVGRWYCVANDGAATLCVDEADARESASEADIAFPRMAPHRAVQLVPADQLAASVAAERERCLQIVESVDNYSNPMTANDCADAIRVERKKNLLPQTKES